LSPVDCSRTKKARHIGNISKGYDSRACHPVDDSRTKKARHIGNISKGYDSRAEK